MENIDESCLYIQDGCNKEFFFAAKTSKITDRNKLPALHDTVVLPVSSSMNGFIYGKTRNYKVVEVRNDYVTGRVIMLLALCEG